MCSLDQICSVSPVRKPPTGCERPVILPGPRYNRAERFYSNLMARNYADETPGTHSRIGYAAAQLVVEGLKRAGPDFTRDAFITALESIKDWSGGLLPPISYSANDHRGLTALAMMRALHGRWLVEKGLLNLKE